MRVTIHSVDPFSPKIEWEITRLPAIIGSSQDAEFQIADRWVCPRQCALVEYNGRVVARDLGNSQRGLLINGESAIDAIVYPGDTLTLGIRSLQLDYEIPDVSMLAKECANGQTILPAGATCESTTTTT